MEEGKKGAQKLPGYSSPSASPYPHRSTHTLYRAGKKRPAADEGGEAAAPKKKAAKGSAAGGGGGAAAEPAHSAAPSGGGGAPQTSAKLPSVTGNPATDEVLEYLRVSERRAPHRGAKLPGQTPA